MGETDRATSGGAHDAGEWIEAKAVMLPGRMMGMSDMEKKKAVEAGGLGELKIRYRVITKEQQAERKRLEELAELDELKDKEINDGNR